MKARSSSEGQFSTLLIKPASYSSSLVDSVGFDLIGSHLGKDLESALKHALAGGVIFPNGTTPLSIFRQVL